MTYVIAEPCIGEKNGACVDVCPVACIHTTPDSPQHYIDPEVCIECEQCALVCPVDAVFLDLKLPTDWQSYIEINASFFRQNKAPEGPVPFDVAEQMIQSAQSYAAEQGAAVTVAIVDGAGTPIAVSGMDGADPRSAEIALARAYTAVMFQVGTHQLVTDARQPWFRSLVASSRGRINPTPGAIPIVAGITTRGAISVAGGRTNEQDVLCCRAGLAVLEAAAH